MALPHGGSLASGGRLSQRAPAVSFQAAGFLLPPEEKERHSKRHHADEHDHGDDGMTSRLDLLELVADLLAKRLGAEKVSGRPDGGLVVSGSSDAFLIQAITAGCA